MPLLTPPRTPIEVVVADRRVQDTLIRQKVRWLSNYVEQAEDGTVKVIVRVRVTMYAAAGDGFGPALIGAGYAERTEELVADNNCIVDAETGEILAIRSPDETGLDWLTKQQSFGERDVMLQGDAFLLMLDQPTNNAALIRQHIRAADLLLHRFA